MSYSMSPPAQKPPPQAYSPYQNAGSPTNPGLYGPPPPKRQRMSPDPRSPPNGVPPYAHQPHGLPNAGPYGNPYAPSAAHSPYGTPTYAQSPHSSFNTPQPYPYQQTAWQSQPPTPAPAPQYGMRQNSPPQQQSREMMPPPPRPNKEEREEKVGVEEIGDSLFGSGINLKDEENYMHSMYNNRHTQNDSFSTNQNTSFGSSTISPNNSFNLLTQGTSFGSQDAAHGAFAGTMGPTLSQEDIELEQRRKRELAAKNLGDRKQHHLNNQFLQCNTVRKRMDRIALKEGVTINMSGVWVKQPETTVMTNGASTNGIAAADDRAIGVQKAESLVNQGSPFEHMVTLISLAAGERERGLLDEAYALSRARRYGDHGRVVPPEFADIAGGEGKQTEEDVIPESITATQWDKAPESDDVEMGEVGKAKEKSSTPQPQPTLSFQGTLNTRLLELAERDREAEADRVKKREARKRAAEATANGDLPTPADEAAPTTNGASAEASAPVKMTKKEQLRQQKERNSNEAAAHSTTNQTAAMMSFGKKGRKYAWMTGGVTNMPTNRFAKTSSASGTATPAGVKTEGGGSGPTTPGETMVRGGSGVGAEPKAPEWGDWREVRVGSGIEVRDLVLVLERDGREKAALQRALNWLS